MLKCHGETRVMTPYDTIFPVHEFIEIRIGCASFQDRPAVKLLMALRDQKPQMSQAAGQASKGGRRWGTKKVEDIQHLGVKFEKHGAERKERVSPRLMLVAM